MTRPTTVFISLVPIRKDTIYTKSIDPIKYIFVQQDPLLPGLPKIIKTFIIILITNPEK